MPVYVSCVAHSERVVTKLLLTQHTIALAVKQTCLNSPGDIMLIQIATADHQVYVFDIKRQPALIHEGLLWRILVSPQLIKIMHDCRSASVALKRQFSLTLHAVFDTQAVYSVLMIHNGLQPRSISLYQLVCKYGDNVDDRHLLMLQESLSGTGLYWAQRPLSKQMLLEACSDVLVLLPHLYHNMNSELCENGLEDTHELTYAYIHGYFKHASKTSKHRGGRTDSHNPMVRLTGQQKQLLNGTCNALQV